MRILQLSLRNYTLLGIIAFSAILLSIFSYEYSLSVADQILQSSLDNIRTNARIQTDSLSLILSKGLDSIITNLQVLSTSRGVQNLDKNDTILFYALQKSTNELPDSYLWIDQNGKLIWSSGGMSTSPLYDKASNYEHMQYFTVPKSTHQPYVATVGSKNNSPLWMYVSYPIIDTHISDGGSTTFKGVVVALIKFDLTADISNKQSLTALDRNLIMLVDTKGTILYSESNSTMMGNNILEYVSRSPDGQRNLLNTFLSRSLHGYSGFTDFESDGKQSTIVSKPIDYNAKQFWTLYVIAPHTLTRDVEILFDQQNNLSSLMIIIIGAVASGVAMLVMSWNKRLEAKINSRTSELKRANDYLQSANKQLENHDRMQKEFINVASHEMKTPTQSILLHSSLLTAHPESGNNSIDAIIRNATRLQRLTYDILDVTRIESQAIKLNKEKFNLKEIIVSIVEEFDTQIDSGKIQLVYNLEDAVVRADKSRITQVISNLFSNAIKFTNEGIIDISMQEKNERGSDKFIVISISDSGPGIDPEILPTLFSKFVTKSDMGVGLGLYISKNLIEAHGGKMWVSTTNGEIGATFSFSLPLSQDDRQ